MSGTANGSAGTPIVQFGTSRFLQAHADLMIDEALARGAAAGAICVIQSSGDPARARRLAALAAPDGFPVRIRGLQDGRRVDREQRVTSVRRALSTATDWEEIVALFEGEAAYVMSNTGDAGFAPRPADSDDSFDQAMSYPAKLRLLLRARFEAGALPITVMPMELVPRNGDVLKARVRDLAAGDPAPFRDWLDHGVLWANSLVDRIVSEGLDPAGAVAEPYALWAVERAPGFVPPCVHPCLTVVGDLAEIETLKLYLLNLGHTLLAERWRRDGGPDTVREALHAPETGDWLERIMSEEVIPGFGSRQAEAARYWERCRERFANPFLDHRLADIAQNHAQKVERRIRGFLDWSGAPAPTLRALCRCPA
jgi:tagaturonate reductase